MPVPSGCADSSSRAIARVLPILGRRWAKTFTALADSTRMEIVCLLAASGAPLCACAIADHFRLAQPTMSHHLRVLREAGLLESERRGVWIFYGLRRASLGEMLEDLGSLVQPPARRGTLQKIDGGR
ncbi:MAG: winged helix-turn-helix transcriptional regulator [Planctomycetes bacterium]|nr:winged helix-turn-helix transcriptional regulator [Planctomycetota bacterium]